MLVKYSYEGRPPFFLSPPVSVCVCVCVCVCMCVKLVQKMDSEPEELPKRMEECTQVIPRVIDELHTSHENMMTICEYCKSKLTVFTFNASP